MTTEPNEKARLYLQRKKVPELFESLLTGLLFHQPDNHISYIEECLASYKQSSESLQWNTFVAMPSAQNSKVFGVDNAENKLPSNTAPLPPITDSQVSVDAEKSPVSAKLDNKSVLPPISSDTTGDQKPETTSTSTLHATEPLPSIADNDIVATSNGTEQTKLKKEDTSPLPPIEAKEIKTNGVNTTESAESTKEEKSPLPPIVEKNETKTSDDIDAAVPSNGIAMEATEIKKVETSPLPPISTDKADVELGNVYFVLGGPGSGKGTQCARIVEKFGLVHLSTGDLLRAEVKKESELGQAIAGIMKEGGLVSSETIVSLLKSAMSEASDVSGFLIDGFPREVDQAKMFEETVCPCSHVLVFHCGDDTMTARLKQRGLSSGREDDNEETIRKRLETFHQQTIPVISHYQQRDKVWEVSAESTVEEVFSKVEKLFNSTAQFSDSQDVTSATSQQNLTTVASKVEMSPLPPIGTDKTDVKFGNVYFVLGGPGSGKGTQCARIVEKFSLVHLSTGDLLRAEVKKGSEQGQAISGIMKEGGLVSSETIVSLLKSAMSEASQANGFLIDGFPREIDQAKMFEETVCPCSRVLVFHCSDDTMTARLKQRGLSSGREDDNEETIRKRLEIFHQQTIPVISHYQQRDKVWEVSAEPTVEEVFSKAEQFFNNSVLSSNSQEDTSITNQQNSTES